MAVGDSNLFFNRDTKVYAVQAVGTSTFNVWEIPVLSGYSFSQSTNSSQITLNEMADATGRSRRGQRAFNDSLAPAEWSFDTYARPTLATVVRAPEEILWHSMFAETNYTATAGQTAGLPFGTGAVLAAGVVTLTFTTAASAGGTYFKVGDPIAVSGVTYTNSSPAVTGTNTFVVTAVTNTTVSYAAPAGTTAVTATSGKVASTAFATTATELDFFTTGSNKTRLGTFDLYFVLGANKAIQDGGTNGVFPASEATTIYKIANACVNEATLNFEIDGIATVSWSGMGKTISEVASVDFSAAGYTLITNGVNSTSNMIRNRLTALNAVGVTPNAKTYGVTLTGGSITISNNMSFLTPEVIGVVNQPLEHVTGTRSVSGSFTCYLDEATNGSIDLYQDLLGATTTVTNKFDLEFFVGGKGNTAGYPAAPGIMFEMGQCHLEIPTINIDDVIAFEVNFTALPTTISGTDELTKIRYVA
jgi:hypothetical protein